MERKIGEIFEYNSEWYQCLKGISCEECDFSSNGITCDIHGAITCTRKGKSDDTSVVFKKLEKVGKPYIKNVEDDLLYQLYKLPINVETLICQCYWVSLIRSDIVEIAIKQNKEEMEEKKQKLDKLVEDYSYNRIPYEVFDNCLKQLYVDKRIGENNPSLKEFDLEAAKAGKPVCTRDGRNARIICFDLKNGEYPIVAAIGNDSSETLLSYTINGEIVKGSYKSEKDLVMLPEKKEGWVNVYMEETNNNERLIEQVIYKTRKDAFDNACPRGYKATTKIEWEE